MLVAWFHMENVETLRSGIDSVPVNTHIEQKEKERATEGERERVRVN